MTKRTEFNELVNQLLGIDAHPSGVSHGVEGFIGFSVISTYDARMMIDGNDDGGGVLFKPPSEARRSLPKQATWAGSLVARKETHSQGSSSHAVNDDCVASRRKQVRQDKAWERVTCARMSNSIIVHQAARETDLGFWEDSNK